MNILIIILLCLFSTTKVTIQGFFGKNAVKTTPDAILFNGLIFVFATAIFIPYLFSQTIPTIVFGGIFGILTVIFQLTYIKALSTGAVSITVMLSNLSMVIPVSVAAIVYKEPITILRGTGIALTIIAFIVCTNFKSEQKLNLKWFLCASTASLANGLGQVCQKVLAIEYGLKHPQSFVAISYFFGLVISVIVYFALSIKGKKRTLKLTPKIWVGTLLMGIALAAFQALYTYAASTMEGTLLYPSYSGGSIVASSLAGLIIFKDKLTTKQKLSILISIVAIVLMNL